MILGWQSPPLKIGRAHLYRQADGDVAEAVSLCARGHRLRIAGVLFDRRPAAPACYECVRIRASTWRSAADLETLERRLRAMEAL